MSAPPPPPSGGPDALLAATLFAVDPQGLGGVVVRAPAGPARDRWLAALRAQLPADTPLRRVPLAIADDRLLGGLDLAATLAAGRPIVQRGVLADAHGGVVVLPMAERMTAGTAARIAAALDAGEVMLERDGFATRMPARFGVVALDESAVDDECVPAGAGRPPRVPPRSVAARGARARTARAVAATRFAAARARLADVRCAPAVVDALCGAGAALGVASLRAPVVRAARRARAGRARRARRGRRRRRRAGGGAGARPARDADARRRASRRRTAAAGRGTAAAGGCRRRARDARGRAPARGPRARRGGGGHAGRVARAVAQSGCAARRATTAGRSGASRDTVARGRPVGSRRGELRGGARLDVLATLRAAAPWQRLRRREAARIRRAMPPRLLVLVRREDFRVKRFRHRAPTTTIFAVDASGSSALHRLAEAKGAVELLLAECYVRRDQVALVAFRGRGAELLLPPTRSLARAKRSLAALPGGGGTPLAAGLDAVVEIAELALRRGETPIVVVLTDGRANVARDGTGGRARAVRRRARGGAARAVRAADRRAGRHVAAAAGAGAGGRRRDGRAVRRAAARRRGRHFRRGRGGHPRRATRGRGRVTDARRAFGTAQGRDARAARRRRACGHHAGAARRRHRPPHVLRAAAQPARAVRRAGTRTRCARGHAGGRADPDSGAVPHARARRRPRHAVRTPLARASAHGGDAGLRCAPARRRAGAAGAAAGARVRALPGRPERRADPERRRAARAGPRGRRGDGVLRVRRRARRRRLEARAARRSRRTAAVRRRRRGGRRRSAGCVRSPRASVRGTRRP